MRKSLLLIVLFSVLTMVSSVVFADAFEYTEEDITIDAGDHQIPATVTIPVGEGKFPFVVMLHGNGSTRHEAGNAYDYTAPEMAKAGIATIRFDYKKSEYCPFKQYPLFSNHYDGNGCCRNHISEEYRSV